MTKLMKQEAQELQDKWIGKKVTLRDESGKSFTGVVTFMGFNRMLPSWGFQVTLNRLPIQHVVPETIELASEFREV